MKDIISGYQCFIPKDEQLKRWENTKGKWSGENRCRTVKNVKESGSTKGLVDKNRGQQKKLLREYNVGTMTGHDTQDELDDLLNGVNEQDLKSTLLMDQASDYNPDRNRLLDTLASLQQALLPGLGEYDWQKGVCYGLSAACVQAALSNDMSTFAERLQMLNRDPERGWLYFGVRYHDLNEAIEHAQELYTLFCKKNPEKAKEKGGFFEYFAKENPDAFELLELRAWCELVFFSQSPRLVDTAPVKPDEASEHYNFSHQEQDMAKTSRYMKSLALDYGASHKPALIETNEHIATVDQAGFTQLLKQLPPGQYPLALGCELDADYGWHSTLLSVDENTISFFDQNKPLFFEKASKSDVEDLAGNIFASVQNLAWGKDVIRFCPLGISGIFLNKIQADAVDSELKHLIKNLPDVDTTDVGGQLNAIQNAEVGMAVIAKYQMQDYQTIFTKKHWDDQSCWQKLAFYLLENGRVDVLKELLVNLNADSDNTEFLDGLLDKAIQLEDVSVIRLLLNKSPVIKLGCLSRSLSDEGGTAIQRAVATGNKDIVDTIYFAVLIAHRTDSSIRKPTLQELAECAVSESQFDLLFSLLGSISVEDEEYQRILKRILTKAINEEDLDTLYGLLEYDVIKGSHFVSKGFFDGSKNALQLALETENLDMVRELLKQGANISGSESELSTLLHEGQLSVSFKQDLLAQVMDQSEYDILEPFLEGVAEDDARVVDELLRQAILTENLDVLDIMMDTGVLRKLGCLGRAITNKGQTAQQLAASTGNKGILHVLNLAAKESGSEP